MSAMLALPLGPISGTRLGRRPGVVLLLCQCCHARPHVLAEAKGGKLIIQPSVSGQHGARHFVVLGADICERLSEDRKIWCACCDRETEAGRILAECRDGLLIIRAYRHQKPHFVALGAGRLQLLLASRPPLQ